MQVTLTHKEFETLCALVDRINSEYKELKDSKLPKLSVETKDRLDAIGSCVKKLHGLTRGEIK